MPIHISGSTSGYTLDRIHAALEGRFSPSDLSEDELPIYYDLLGKLQNGGREQARAAFAKKLMNEPGNVGYDEADNLVLTLGGGKLEVIEPAAAVDGLKTK